jgi:hypothetical protein
LSVVPAIMAVPNTGDFRMPEPPTQKLHSKLGGSVVTGWIPLQISGYVGDPAFMLS